jgi:uracil-DNA glycosylase
MAAISNDWAPALRDEYRKPYYKDLFLKVNEEYSHYQVFPPAVQLFIDRTREIIG